MPWPKLAFPPIRPGSPLNDHVPGFIKARRRRKFLKNLLPTLAFALALTGSSLIVFRLTQPRLSVTAQTKKLLPKVEAAAASLDQVDKSLKDLHRFIIGEDISYKRDLKPWLGTKTFATLLEGILGAKENSLRNRDRLPLLTTREKNLRLKKVTRELAAAEAFGQNDRVLGTASAEPETETPPPNLFKRQKRLAANCRAKVKKITTDLLNLKVARSRSGNGPLAEVLEKLDQTVFETENYLAEVKKTADYYFLISASQETLSPTLAAFTETVEKVSRSKRPYLYLKKIGRIKKDFGDTLSKIKGVKEANLPFGFQAIHEDNLKILSLLVEASQDIVLAIKDNDYDLLKETMRNLSLSMEETAGQAAELETGFWKNNKRLWSYPQLKKSYEETENDLRSLYEKNRLPFQPR